MPPGPVLYYIYMEGCGACERAKPHLARWERKHPGLLRVHRIGARVLYRQSDLDKCLSAIVNPKRRAA